MRAESVDIFSVLLITGILSRKGLISQEEAKEIEDYITSTETKGKSFTEALNAILRIAERKD